MDAIAFVKSNTHLLDKNFMLISLLTIIDVAMSKSSYITGPHRVVLITNDIKVSHGNQYIYPKFTDVFCFWQSAGRFI